MTSSGDIRSSTITPALYSGFIPAVVTGEQSADVSGVIGGIAKLPPNDRTPRRVADFTCPGGFDVLVTRHPPAAAAPSGSG